MSNGFSDTNLSPRAENSGACMGARLHLPLKFTWWVLPWPYFSPH